MSIHIGLHKAFGLGSKTHPTELVAKLRSEATHPETGKFVSGNKAALRSAPNSRKKLAMRFMAAMLITFEEEDANGVQAGIAAIRKVRDEDPVTYVNVLAKIMPKEIHGMDGERLLSGVTVTFVKPTIDA